MQCPFSLEKKREDLENGEATIIKSGRVAPQIFLNRRQVTTMGKEKKKGKSDRDDGSSLQAAQPASNVNDTVNEDIYQSQSGEGQVDIDGAQSSDDDN